MDDRTNHANEVKGLNGQISDLTSRIGSLRDRNEEFFARQAKSPLTPQEAETERRRNIEKALRDQYILSHENISPGILAGTQDPPAEWMNRRLQELGENWRVSGPEGKSDELLPVLLSMAPGILSSMHEWSQKWDSDDLQLQSKAHTTLTANNINEWSATLKMEQSKLDQDHTKSVQPLMESASRLRQELLRQMPDYKLSDPDRHADTTFSKVAAGEAINWSDMRNAYASLMNLVDRVKASKNL